MVFRVRWLGEAGGGGAGAHGADATGHVAGIAFLPDDSAFMTLVAEHSVGALIEHARVDAPTTVVDLFV